MSPTRVTSSTRPGLPTASFSPSVGGVPPATTTSTLSISARATSSKSLATPAATNAPAGLPTAATSSSNPPAPAPAKSGPCSPTAANLISSQQPATTNPPTGPPNNAALQLNLRVPHSLRSLQRVGSYDVTPQPFRSFLFSVSSVNSVVNSSRFFLFLSQSVNCKLSPNSTEAKTCPRPQTESSPACVPPDVSTSATTSAPSKTGSSSNPIPPTNVSTS